MEHTDRKKPATDFVVRMIGPGMRPWVVPFRNLARVLDAVQRLVDQREDDDENGTGGGDSPEPVKANDGGADRTLVLVDIKSGSASYPVSAKAPEVALRTLEATGQAISDPENADWTAASVSAIRELSEVARSLGCQIEFRKPGPHGKFGEVLATIRPTTIDHIRLSAFIRGPTSVYARIERLGGATETHCGIRLADQPRRMVICHFRNPDIVRQLGPHLYEEVLLTGHATWLRHNMILTDLLISDFQPPKTGSFMDALKRIHDAGGSAWDEIKDPDAFISEMRGA